MKKLYLIGGTMGVGKTNTCQILKAKLQDSVFLDGDWCWDMHPFQVTLETKKMVLENISFLLNKFIHCTAYENIIFCWVMHGQDIIDDILSRLDTADCQVNLIFLVCSLERIALYEKLETIKIDVSDISQEQAAELSAEIPHQKIQKNLTAPRPMFYNQPQRKEALVQGRSPSASVFLLL